MCKLALCCISPPQPSGVTRYKSAHAANICVALPESGSEYDIVQHAVHSVDNSAT